MSKEKEVALPSGKFARVRSMTVGDMIACCDANHYAMGAKLAVRCATIDGEQITLDQVLAMDFEDFAPINEVLGGFLIASMQTRKGVA